MHSPIDYATLRVIWWMLMGILLIGFAIMDGFDLGVGILLPVVAKSDLERRVVINTIGPVWEGNQVWLVLGAAAVFAAWPPIYAVAFSGFYFAMFLILAALIIRPVGLKFRSKMPSLRWRQWWDRGLFISGFVPALIFGVAVGNVLQGMPFYFDADLRIYYSGTFWELLDPFALSCGLLSVAMLTMQGAAFLLNKTTGVIQQRALTALRLAAPLTIFLFIAAGLWITFGMDGFLLAKPIAHDGLSNPLHKTVVKVVGAWNDNYVLHHWMLIAPLLGLFGALGAILFGAKDCLKTCMVSSSLSILGIIASVGLSMFPFILPSSVDLQSSLLVWDASSSQTTLFLMLVAAAFFMPIILLYTAWVYRVMRGKVTEESVTSDSKTAY